MTNDEKTFPANWLVSDYNPNEHMMNLKGRDYLNVQNRLLWFIRDQRDFIVRGLATTSYVIRTELIQHDREAGYAHFSTYVRDVLGNEATMYGSETAKDFGDYAEKASTKSLGRALLALGYGTAAAPEMDEGERVVDSPVERSASNSRQNAPSRTHGGNLTAQPENTSPAPAETPAARSGVGTQETTVTDSMQLTHASAEDQRRLVEALRKHGYTTQTAVEALLESVCKRHVNAEALRASKSDISLKELSMVYQRLTHAAQVAEQKQQANGKAAR